MGAGGGEMKKSLFGKFLAFLIKKIAPGVLGAMRWGPGATARLSPRAAPPPAPSRGAGRRHFGRPPRAVVARPRSCPRSGASAPSRGWTSVARRSSFVPLPASAFSLLLPDSEAGTCKGLNYRYYSTLLRFCQEVIGFIS